MAEAPLGSPTPPDAILQGAADVFVYGPPGAGKSWIGRFLADERGFRFEDGDQWLPKDLRESLRRGKAFTDGQRERFAGVVADELARARDEEARRPAGARRIVVAQAMLKARHRGLIAARHPDLLFVLATADAAVLQRRLSGGANLVGGALGAAMAAMVEAGAGNPVIRSASADDATVPAQIDAILAAASILATA
ncbi:hypothetical protein M885DRAFT_578763 [Pelagophyceae sp. CCMP2097]|nr:hypothetical protein M885DRAFT_578763 [Pelagophyceae sp. CCMP2097]